MPAILADDRGMGDGKTEDANMAAWASRRYSTALSLKCNVWYRERMELVQPSLEYKESFLDMMREEDTSPWRRNWKHDALAFEDFPLYIEKLLGQAEGKYLEEGWVPCSEYWLVDDGKVVGRLSLRHTLTESLRKIGGHIGYNIRPSARNRGCGKEILRLGLLKAKELGIDRVLLTCDETNTASKKVIEANGGVAEEPYDQGAGVPRKLRFWIAL